MKCPYCSEGTIYAFTPIVYEHEVQEDGTIVKADTTLGQYEDVEDEAECDECGASFDIHDGKVVI